MQPVMRGEIETKRSNTETEVLVPWRIASRMARVAVALVLTLYLFIWGTWLLSNDMHAGPLFAHLRRWWLAWVFPLVAGYVAPYGLLVWFDYIPKLRNANWPPPWAQAMPLETGFFDAYHMPYQRQEDAGPRTVEHVINGSIAAGEGKSYHWRLATAEPEAWKRFAVALTRPPAWLRAKPSVRAARAFGVPEQEFTNLVHGWISIGFAERTSDAKNAHVRLTDRGAAYMRALAEQV